MAHPSGEIVVKLIGLAFAPYIAAVNSASVTK